MDPPDEQECCDGSAEPPPSVLAQQLRNAAEVLRLAEESEAQRIDRSKGAHERRNHCCLKQLDATDVDPQLEQQKLIDHENSQDEVENELQLDERHGLDSNRELQLPQQEFVELKICQDEEENRLQQPSREQNVWPSSHDCQPPGSLLPGMPNPVALHCLARVPRSLYPFLRAVSRCWREALSSRDIYSIRKELGCTESWIYLSFSPRTLHRDRVRNWIEAYDPVTNMWKPICWVPGLQDAEMLKGFGFVGLNGRFYVIGGRLCNKAVSSPVEIRSDVLMYDCFANEWSVCTRMSSPRVDFACAISDGCIYVMGGRSVAGHEKGVASAEVYDPEADRWDALPNMSISRYKCAGVTLKGKIYVIGGFTSSESPQSDAFALNRSSVEIYDAERKRWEFVKGMWQLDVPPYQVVNLEGQLYSSGDVLNSWKGHLEVYDEMLNMWKPVLGSKREDLECEGQEALRRYVTMAPIGNRIFLFEGYCQKIVDQQCLALDRVLTFNPTDIPDTEHVAKWEASEALHTSCRDLCSHCCLVEA